MNLHLSQHQCAAGKQRWLGLMEIIVTFIFIFQFSTQKPKLLLQLLSAKSLNLLRDMKRLACGIILWTMWTFTVCPSCKSQTHGMSQFIDVVYNFILWIGLSGGMTSMCTWFCASVSCSHHHGVIYNVLCLMPNQNTCNIFLLGCLQNEVLEHRYAGNECMYLVWNFSNTARVMW